MTGELEIPIFAPEEVQPPKSSRLFLITAALMLIYATFYGGLCGSFAYADSETQREWTPVVVSLLFPVGEWAYFFSQLAGGFLGVIIGPSVGDFGASIPLFVPGFAIGLAQGAVVVAIVNAALWLRRVMIRKVDASPPQT